AGTDGNIRAGNILRSENDYSGNVFYNPGPGTGGAHRERIEDVRKRFIRDMEASYTAVTERDYEELVRTTPGLCIHKAKAYMDDEKNLVSIAIKPGTDELYPRLSNIYIKMIQARLEERRLLSARIELVQPVYTAVNVSGSVYVKLHYEYSLEEITETIRQHIDYLNSDKNFGDRLHFDEVFHAIEMLECVEYVYDLSLRPQSNTAARIEDSDICPNVNCLLYPGQIDIETISFEE
ncbi:MAG: baseplate J/gp47 family protein, partial [Lachnospiraceae bacterium]|nr:baseplate J/gp47 family protein [Lachnospiraceae bacterium]